MLSGHIVISDDTLRTIGIFSINWSVFEAVHLQSNASPRKIKKLKIDFIKQREDFQNLIDEFRKHICNFLLDRSEAIDYECIQQYLYTEVAMQKLSEHQDDINLIQYFLNKSNDDYRAALLCIYRIRNNFFHGTKDFYSLDCQKDLFDSASRVLYYLCP